MKWFFILSVIAWTGKPVRSSCPFEMSPARVVVRFGDPISVNCSSELDRIESMGWESVVGGTGTQFNVSSVVLEVESVKSWELRPICFINPVVGDQCSQTLSVTVYNLPESVSISQPSEMGPMVEGKQYRMQCDIVNVKPLRNLTVHWHKGNKIIATDTFDQSSPSFPVNTSSFYDLTAQRGDNGTEIWCDAKLDFLPDLHTIHSKSREVIVLYSPAFTKPENETLELSARSEIILNCTAEGNPTPVYSWHLPHAIQQNNQNENQPVLTPSPQLPGTYNCTASNSQGTQTKYFTVIEATRNYTTLAALLGVGLSLGAVLFVGLLFLLTPEGSFYCSKGSYMPGRPTSSGPV